MASHGIRRESGKERKSEQARQLEAKKIEEYKELVGALQAKMEGAEFTTEVLTLTSKLLRRNPEYYTVWNHRRRVLREGLFSDVSSQPDQDRDSSKGDNNSSEHSTATAARCSSLIRSDLTFLVPLLRQFPKCYWIWNHRIWLLEQATARLPRLMARELWQEELGLVGKMLALDGRNFHGWGYRRIVVQQLESARLAPDKVIREAEAGAGAGAGIGADTSARVGVSMAEEELEYTMRMIRTNLSNFSAWHYRTTLIPRLLDERRADDFARRKFIDDEFDLILQGLYTEPSDQSLWFYHEWLTSIFSSPQSTTSSSSSSSSSSIQGRVLPNLTIAEKSSRIDQQIQVINEMLDDDGTQDCKWIYEALLRYTLIAKHLREYAGRYSSSDHHEDEHRKVQDRQQQQQEQEEELQLRRRWLTQLRKLDPLRNGRWDDLEKSLLS